MSYKSKAGIAADVECGEKAAAAPCRICANTTDHELLSKHGGMCLGCFDSWRRRPIAETPDIGDKMKDGPRAWAVALRKREQCGERLTPFQRQAWRDALGAVGSEQ